MEIGRSLANGTLPWSSTGISGRAIWSGVLGEKRGLGRKMEETEDRVALGSW